MAINRKYGWKRDIPDHRDYRLAYERIGNLPSVVDLRSSMPKNYDQGDSSSCTGNGIAGAIEHQLITQKLEEFTPSRLFIYYGEREMEGTTASDAGASIRDGIKFVASQGTCSEQDWPFDLTKLYTKPSDNCYTDARKNIVERYTSLGQNLPTLKSALAKGFPIICGITIYESFESDDVAASGVVPMPGKKEECLGGHCVDLIGYSDADHWFIGRNSWSDTWGAKGNFYIPYNYITDNNLSDDFWTIELVK